MNFPSPTQDYIIPLVEGNNLISDYIDHFQLYNPNTPYSRVIGGTVILPSDKEKFDAELEGYLFWWCLSSNGDIFLTFTSRDNIDPNDFDEGHLTPGSQDVHIYHPFETYLHLYSGGSSPSNFLQNHSPQLNPGTPVLLSLNDIIHANSDFRVNGPSDRFGNPYNEIPYGLFGVDDVDETSSDFLEWLRANNISRFRYYYGYDAEKAINQIRIVIVGVNEEGQNITMNAPIIQKSWPPREDPTK